MANILLLIENDFEDMEAMYPYYRMQEAGHRITVVGAEPGIYYSKHGYPLRADKTPEEIDLAGYGAVIIPGGQAPDRMRTKKEMVRLVRAAVQKDLLVAAICHGPQMLIEAGAVRGKRATCYISVKTDLINAGAQYADSPVVTDGRLVTSRQPGDLPAFCGAIVEMLARGSEMI